MPCGMRPRASAGEPAEHPDRRREAAEEPGAERHAERARAGEGAGEGEGRDREQQPERRAQATLGRGRVDRDVDGIRRAAGEARVRVCGEAQVRGQMGRVADVRREEAVQRGWGSALEQHCEPDDERERERGYAEERQPEEMRDRRAAAGTARSAGGAGGRRSRQAGSGGVVPPGRLTSSRAHSACSCQARRHVRAGRVFVPGTSGRQRSARRASI